MARGDLLRLRPAVDFKEDGIHIKRHKTAGRTGKRTIYTWNDDLRAAVAEALAARPVDISPWLLCTLKSEGYIDEETGRAGGRESLWRGFMQRAMAETGIKGTVHRARHPRQDRERRREPGARAPCCRTLAATPPSACTGARQRSWRPCRKQKSATGNDPSSAL